MKTFAWFPFLLVVSIFHFLPSASIAQKTMGKLEYPNITFYSVAGTGQTTGHIANITLANTGETALTILPQTVYIPSTGQYQPYVAVIPGTTLPPGQNTVIPLDGFCADVHTSPVPPGETMPPLDTWVPVGDPTASIPDGSLHIIPTTPVERFTPEDIPTLVTLPEFKPVKPDPEAEITITWPGTDIPVGGVFDPGKDPKSFGPVLIAVVEQIEHAIDNEQRVDFLAFNTPFSSDPPKERDAIIQHLIWIYTAALTGDKYEKENFADKVYTQFHDHTGTKVNALPKDQKEEMDEGIDDFWNTFTAVGTEAKVLSIVKGSKQ
jgi:hypothetical protein